MIPYHWIEEAAERIQPHIRVTELTYDPHNDLFLKWENHQITGSFKARGAINKVLTLVEWEREAGLVAASAGNHGQGVALAAGLVGTRAVIFSSENAPQVKLEAMRSLGAEVHLVQGGYAEAEREALTYAQETGAVWISPYNDGQVIAGQGTLGIETLYQLPPLHQVTWIVPVGGGGLISGIGAAIHGVPTHDAHRLIGVQSQASPFGHAVFHTGSQAGAVEKPSLEDGLAGPIEDQSLTIPLMRRFLDDFVLVSEEEIAEAIRYAWNRYQEKLEGSAAAALAAALTGKVPHRPAVVVLTGGNIQPELHSKIVAGMLEAG